MRPPNLGIALGSTANAFHIHASGRHAGGCERLSPPHFAERHKSAVARSVRRLLAAVICWSVRRLIKIEASRRRTRDAHSKQMSKPSRQWPEGFASRAISMPNRGHITFKELDTAILANRVSPVTCIYE